jgi:hypothetical protein
MTFARIQDTRGLYVLEDHILRHIILFFTRSAYDASKLDYEKKVSYLTQEDLPLEVDQPKVQQYLESCKVDWALHG